MTEVLNRAFETVVAPILVWAATGLIGVSIMAAVWVVKLGGRVKRLEERDKEYGEWLVRVEQKLDQALLNSMK